MIVRYGETVIAQKMANMNGEDVMVDILYGNIVQLPDGTKKAIDEKVYEKLWESFFEEHQGEIDGIMDAKDIEAERKEEELLQKEEEDAKRLEEELKKIEEEKARPQYNEENGNRVLQDSNGVEFQIEYKDRELTAEEKADKRNQRQANLEAMQEARDAAEAEGNRMQQLQEERIDAAIGEARNELATREAEFEKKRLEREKELEKRERALSRKEKSNGDLWLKILSALMALMLLLMTLFGLYYTGVIPKDLFTRGQEVTATAEDGYYYVVQLAQDVPKDATLKAEDLEQGRITEEEYKQLNTTVYISPDGTSNTSSLVLWENKDSVVGKFATRNLSKGTRLGTYDYSNEKIVAEKTYIEAEIDGQTVSIPVDSILTGDTRVKVVALVNTQGRDGTLAISLSEFVLENSSLKDIFDSAGQSILSQIAGDNAMQETPIESVENPQ